MADYPCPLSVENITPFEKGIDLTNLPFIENEIKGENNILYNIKIYNAKQSIIFSLKKINDFSEMNYKNEYTLEQLNKIDIFSNNYKSIEEIYTDFFQNFKKKEIILLENKNKINLCYKFENLGKLKEIKFIFDDYNLNIEKTIFKICDKIKEIEKLNINIKEIKERNKELEEKLEKYNNKLNEQQNNIKNNEKKIDEEIKKIKEENEINNNNNKEILIEFNKIKEEIKKYKVNFGQKKRDNQNILDNKKEIYKNKKKLEENRKETIQNIIGIFSVIIVIIALAYSFQKFNNKIKYLRFISQIEKDNFNFKSLTYDDRYLDYFKIFKSFINEGIKKYFNKEIKNINLLYQASIDGFENFHIKCDGKKYTVTLVRTEKNIIFGGFTELEWDSSNTNKKGDKGFIFSLNEKKIYFNKNEYYIFRSGIEGPDFYDIFYIIGKNGYSYKNLEDYFGISEKDYNIIWNKEFSIKDYAVFQLELN